MNVLLGEILAPKGQRKEYKTMIRPPVHQLKLLFNIDYCDIDKNLWSFNFSGFGKCFPYSQYTICFEKDVEELTFDFVVFECRQVIICKISNGIETRITDNNETEVVFEDNDNAADKREEQ